MPYRSRQLNANLTKGAANLSDVLRILELWDPDQDSRREFRERAVEWNLLGKASRSRAADLWSAVFCRRYVPNASGQPARRLRQPRHGRSFTWTSLTGSCITMPPSQSTCCTDVPRKLLYDYRTRGS